MPLPALHELIELLLVGLLAGVLGGLLGIGGSIVMIPGVTIFLGRDQHLAQAAAMIVNIFVALPSAYRHHQASAVRWDIMARMLPSAMVFIILGVIASNQFPGEVLKKLFGAFLLYVIAHDATMLFDDHHERHVAPGQARWLSASAVGAIMGFAAGLLGIGAGIIAVPLLQRLCKLPLRQAIATSAAAMCLTAIVGAVMKNATLWEHDLPVSDSLMIAACLIPTAIAGSYLGAGLTHSLPLRWVRVAFLLLTAWASLDMLGAWDWLARRI